MTTPKAACYRHEDSYLVRNAHLPDCVDTACRGCKPCGERHCTARRSCAWHIDAAELTCGRCIAGTRQDLATIADLAALMDTQALTDGVDSEAANLAGPAADAEAWIWRKHAAVEGRAWHQSLTEDDDRLHPLRVLGTWEAMLREDYGQPTMLRVTVASSAAYLDSQLHRLAHDPEQDYPLMRSEVRRCRQHLEAVLHNDTRPDRGVPCYLCTSHESGVGPRLIRHYAHWCDDPDCHRTHDDPDVWRCPDVPAHRWTHAEYEMRLVARRTNTGANTGADSRGQGADAC